MALVHGLLTATLLAGPLPAQTVAVEFGSGADSFSAADREIIRAIAEATVEEVRRIIPELPDDIKLTASAGPEVIPETGDAAAALEPGHVLWVVDPSRPGGVENIAREHLRASLFHELHHLARGYVMIGADAPISLMDAVVSEGLATVFSRDFADDRPPWGLYPPDVRDWVEELLAVRIPDGESYQDWLYDHPDGRRWIGYRAGTWVVDQAVAASGLSAAQLVSTPTDEILRLAGFE